MEFLGITIPSQVYQIFLLILGAIVGGLFRDILPNVILSRRKESKQRVEEVEQWHTESLQAIQELNNLILRQANSPKLNYQELQQEFDKLANTLSTLADDHRSPDNELPESLGSLSESCVHFATLCEIYSDNDGTDRLLETLRFMDIRDIDLSLEETMKIGKELPDELTETASLDARHINEDALEQIEKDYPGGRLCEEDSLFNPMVVDLIVAIDDSRVNMVSDDLFRNIMTELVLDASEDLKEEVRQSRETHL